MSRRRRQSAPRGLRLAHGLSEVGPKNPVEPRERPAPRQEVVRAFEVGRIKRSAAPALVLVRHSTSIRCRTRTNAGSASLRSFDPADSLKSRRLPLWLCSLCRLLNGACTRFHAFSGRSRGNRITSRIDFLSVSSITSRSMPTPRPPAGGIACRRARTKSWSILAIESSSS